MRHVRFKSKHYLRIGGGPEKRVNLLRTLITALVKHERIELGYRKAFETQKYAERLINVAKRGDQDAEAMKIADFWLTLKGIAIGKGKGKNPQFQTADKKQVHKLFKVLGPRFEGTHKNFTQLLRVPGFLEERGRKMAFLEYLGNPYPALIQEPKRNPDWLLNVLVQGAVQELRDSRVVEELEVVASADREYQANLEGVQHAIDSLAVRDLMEGQAPLRSGSQSVEERGKRGVEASGEGTPV